MNSTERNLKNLEIGKKYFSSEITLDDLKDHLAKVYDKNFIDFETDFYKTPINANPETTDEIIQILLGLNVDINLWGSYLNQDLSVYDFLVELAKDHETSIQLNQLIDVIVKRKYQNLINLSKKIGLATAIVLPFVAALTYPIISGILDFLLKSANFIPVLGILFSIGSLAFNIYLNHLNNRRPTFKIYRDDGFVVASNALNIAAKVILIVSKGILAHLASVFFIASSLVDTTKELFYLLELRRKHKTQPAYQENDLPIIHQQHARQTYGYLKQRNTFLINFVSSLLLTGLVIGCSFFPVGLALTISTCISISIVYLIKTLVLHLNTLYYAARLQTELKEISRQHTISEVNDSNYVQYRHFLHLKDAPLPPVDVPEEKEEATPPPSVPVPVPVPPSEGRKQPLSHAHSRFFRNTLILKTASGKDLEVSPHPSVN